MTTADQLYTAFIELHALGYSPLFRLIPWGNEGKIGINIVTAGGMSQEVSEYARRKDKTKLDKAVTDYCTNLDALGFSQVSSADRELWQGEHLQAAVSG